MPAHTSDGSSLLNLDALSVACPRPLTPPPQFDGDLSTTRDLAHLSVNHFTMSPPASDNTAAGMSIRQEQSMYSLPDAPRDAEMSDTEKERGDVVMPEDGIESTSTKQMDLETPPASEDTRRPETPSSLQDSATPQDTNVVPEPAQFGDHMKTQLRTPSPTISTSSAPSIIPARRVFYAAGIPSIDTALNHTRDARPWDFSKRKLRTRYPSALFQTNSKYIGTQQSDRQIYNVEVTILTVDMEQCTTSGYLQICGLTPDHPTLTTFFTGDIIGGPDQKFSFRTKNPDWGATDKTDMMHWARFPAWRSLSSQAKQNLSFVHPSDQSPWWQQENIFMRWKEHFLVPDYKLKSIQGASFEGFYYICLNQIEGKISGIYFHSKSEK